MSKITYEEAINIIKQRINTIRLNTKIGSRTIADKENAVLLNHIEYNLNRLCEQAQKQEKLLNLYREKEKHEQEFPALNNIEYEDYQRIKTKIRELENE